MNKKIVFVVAIFGAIVLSLMPVYAQEDYNKIEAKVIEDKGVQNVEQEDGTTKKEQSTQIRILEGEYEHEEYPMTYVISEDVDGIISNTELKENDVVLVSVEEKDGEVTNITYRETVKKNYYLYAALIVLVILAVLIARKNAVKPLVSFMLTILAIFGAFLLALNYKLNIILIGSIASLIITIFIAIKVNGINKKTFVMIACSIVGTAVAGIMSYILFDFANLTNVNIKISQTYINIKEIFVTATILFGGTLANIIVLSSLNMFNFLNKPYKTKSDNIIEGQRSLKL